MSSQVQRKLEFLVKKSSQSQKIIPACIQLNEAITKNTRSSRLSALNNNCTNTITPDKTLVTSPRKRLNDDKCAENRPVFNTPSPTKKKKENKIVDLQRDETPMRTSLAVKLERAKLTDGNTDKLTGDTDKLVGSLGAVEHAALSLPSPRKAFSPIKVDNQSNIKVCHPASPKSTLVPLKLFSSSSPQKVPVLRLAKLECGAYHHVKQMFHTAKPDRIVGRDVEITEVHSFLDCHMTEKTGGSLYVSGAPGTGKTAVLTHIIDELKSEHSCKTFYLNCMTLENATTVYGKLYTDITGKRAPSAKERLRAIEKVLTADGPSIVLVLDEIDQLDSKNHEILYTIFEWPVLPQSRLILVGISNALDLTDRILPRLQAKPNCKPKLLNFAPYTKDQISLILKDRIKDVPVEVMEQSALLFCARKISAVAGDVRKALDVCRRAVELVETDVKSQRVLMYSDSVSKSPSKEFSNLSKKVAVVHINNVLSDIYGCGVASHEQDTIPLQQKIAMCSLLLLLKKGKMKEVTAGKLHEIYCKVCKSRHMAAVDQSEFHGILTLLESRGMLAVKKAKESRMCKVMLKLDEKELEHAMQDKVLISCILNEGIPK